VEELLAGDLVILIDGVYAHLLDGFALAGGLARDVEREVHGKLVRAVEIGPATLFTMDCVVALPDLGLLNDGLLSPRFFAVALDGEDVRGVHGAHDVEVLELITQFDKFVAGGLNTHHDLLSQNYNESMLTERMSTGRARVTSPNYMLFIDFQFLSR